MIKWSTFGAHLLFNYLAGTIISLFSIIFFIISVIIIYVLEWFFGFFSFYPDLEELLAFLLSMILANLFYTTWMSQSSQGLQRLHIWVSLLSLGALQFFFALLVYDNDDYYNVSDIYYLLLMFSSYFLLSLLLSYRYKKSTDFSYTFATNIILYLVFFVVMTAIYNIYFD